MADSITPQELKALMGSDRKPAVFDVRRKIDFEAAPKKIGSATWLDPEKADEWIAEIPQEQAGCRVLCQRRFRESVNCGSTSANPS